MFEQSYVNTTPAEPLHEGDFLYHFELPSWQLGPRLYQILGASVAVNLVLLSIFGQASFLTAKGCDGPLVGKVCQVLDTVYIGTMLFGTDREYADVEYDPTRLSKDDDVTFVDVSNLEAKLDYPESYVDMSTGQTVPMIGGATTAESSVISPGYLAPGIPSNPTITTTPDLTNTPQVLPPANPNAVEGTLPTFNDPNPTTPRNRRNPRLNKIPNNTTVADVNANTNTNSNPTVQNPNSPNANTATQQDQAVVDKNGVFINKRPLTDQAKQTLADLNANKVKLDAPFKVVVEGTLGLAKDGKTIVLKNPKLVPDPNVKNDPIMEKLVSDWILRVGDSGWFGYLDKLDQKGKLKTKKIQVAVEQNNTDFVASIRSEMPSENEARTASSGLGLLISGGILTTSGDEQTFLKSATTGVDGSSLIFNFKMPTADVQQVIQRKLADLEKSVNQPNSTAVVGPSNSTAAK
jgi:hypothetical protein